MSHETSQDGLLQQLKSFNMVFWIANTIEMIERLAYYGLRTVVPVYMLLAVEEGGPQFDNIQKGMIFAWWAAVQSFVPIFSGSFADRIHYKGTIGVSIAVKIAGYLLMAFAVDLAGIMTGGTSLGEAGHPVTFYTFAAGALLLALGTAIFKPGIQGILALQMTERNASTGWALFYQLVNLGGFLGPFLAGAMRLMAWKWVFVSCAIIVAINYLLLLMFKEPEVDRKPMELLEVPRTLWRTGIGICEPRLMAFLVVFSGFWAMFNQLFDLLPNYIEDWVDSSAVLTAVVAPLLGVFGGTPPEAWGGNVPQEFMINLNAGMIMIMAFAVGFVTGKIRSMTAMVVGILISAAGIAALGLSTSGWVVLGCIALFSLGEMSASPTKMRYFSSIAPPGKKAQYLGYINATNGIGWALGSMVAGAMYEEGGDKVVLARRHLIDAFGQPAEAVEALQKTEVLPRLAEVAELSVADAQALLYATYQPNDIWFHFASIGVVSMVGLIAYDQITRRNLAIEAWILVALTALLAGWTYGLLWAAIFSGMMLMWMAIHKLNPNYVDVHEPEEAKKAA